MKVWLCLVVVTATHSSLHSMLPVHDQHLSIDPVVLTAEIYLMEAGKVMKSMNITEHALSSREIIFQTRFWGFPHRPYC